jgi:hypothetical protein
MLYALCGKSGRESNNAIEEPGLSALIFRVASDPQCPLTTGSFSADCKLRFCAFLRVLLFLNPVSQYGLTSPVGLDQGRFRVLRNAKGQAFAVNGRDNLGLFLGVPSGAAENGVRLSGDAETMMAKTRGQAPLAALEDSIVRLAGAAK